MRNKHQKDQRSWVCLHLPSMEADLAYFEARLILLGQPDTAYQHAQQKIYETLEKSMRDMIDRLDCGTREIKTKGFTTGTKVPSSAKST